MGAGLMTQRSTAQFISDQLTPDQRREAELATQRIAVFERRYGIEALALACHAAFPMALTAELVYCLRENFGQADVPWYAAADVVLSGLCQPIGHDLYEMPGAVRIQLLQQLKEVFGEQRVWDLEAFMGDYILAQLGVERQQAAGQGNPSRERSRILGDRPHWTALCCLSPGAVREEIQQALLEIARDTTERERLHLSAMVESYGALLPGEPILLDWAEQVAEGETITTDWTDWAKAEGITLVPKVVQVARIRFGDDPVQAARELDPNVLRPFEFEVVTVNERGQIASRKMASANYFVEPLGGVPPLELVAIPGGRFLMGSPENEAERDEDESPQHWVDVEPFFMGKYPVRQDQWRFVAGLPQVNRELDLNPSDFEGDDRPVENVSWLDAQEFCARVSVLAGRTCRLPTEAEWEYACRAGTTTPFHFGETISTELANYDGNYTYGKGRKGQYQEETTDVGAFKIANAFGLYDMHGNVWEWCADHFHENYKGAPADGSAWIDSDADEDASRILRGGSWILVPWRCRSAYRFRGSADVRDYDFGFRIVYSRARILL
jgi:formylglycine-generating enzyme required for sulfatase activity